MTTEDELTALRARVAELELELKRAASGTPGLDRWQRALVEHAPSFMTVVDPSGRIVAEARSSTNFGPVVGRTVYDFIDPADHDVVRANLARACATAEPVQYQVTAFGEGGVPNHVYRVRATPLGPPGAVDALVIVPTDITEHVRLARSVQESEQALRIAIEATHMGLWTWDLAGDRVTWDERLLEIWGLSTTPPDYDAYRNGVHPDDRWRIDDALHQALETGTFPTFEHRLPPGPDGKSRHLLAVGTVIKDERGRPVRLMGGVLDVTEQRRLEGQLARAGRIEAIGQLTAGIAHNFNNLLTAIIPNLELALGHAAGSVELKAELKAALDAALQARDVVKSLLALAKGREADSDVAHADPQEAVARALAVCRATFPRDIQLSSTVAADVRSVAMASTDLEQVLLNLLLNARDAVEGAARREVRVEVDRVPPTAGAAGWTRIRVVDTGAGMSPDVRARIFEPFFTTKPPHQGSGLGLANSLLRVTRAGGKIDCTTAPGAGATFELLLPEAARTTHTELSTAPPAKATGQTILLVDDEAMVRSAVRRVLEAEGYRVLEAASAAAARAALGGEAGAQVKLIILDHSMPAQTGLDALPSIRALSSAPVILFSGLLPERPEGVAALLEKPARPAELCRQIREVLYDSTG